MSKNVPQDKGAILALRHSRKGQPSQYDTTTIPKVGLNRDKTNGRLARCCDPLGMGCSSPSKRRGWRAFFLARFTAGRPELPPKVDSAISGGVELLS